MPSLIANRRVTLAGRTPLPAWLVLPDSVAPDLMFDFSDDSRAWSGGRTVTIASLLTCTRTTNNGASPVESGVAYGRDASGIWQPFAQDTLRYDYSSGVRRLLVEEKRTNLCLQSNDFTSASWTKTNMTAAKTATGADGVANSASTLTATAGNATALQAITSASAARITSAFIKRRTGSGNIDITQNNGTTWTTVSVTSSWQRLSIASATAANPTVGIRIVTSGDAVDVMWFQHELGAFATSPIPTTSAAVARPADAVSMTLPVALQGLAAYTMFAEWNDPATSTARLVACARATGDNTNRLEISPSVSNTSNSVVASSNTDYLVTSARALNAGSNKQAFAYNATDGNDAINGTLNTLDTSITLPAASIAELWVGARGGGSFYLNGSIGKLALWGSRRSDSALASITAP